MFLDYLDVYEREVVKGILTKKFYQFALDKEEMPLFEPLKDFPKFWADLCFLRFGKTPTKLEEAKQFFINEYLTQKAMAIYKRIAQYLDRGDYKIALELGEKAAEKFGVLGHIFYLYACQITIGALTDTSQIDDLREIGLQQIAKIEKSLEDPEAMKVIRHSTWQKTIDDRHGGFENFLEEGREHFSQFKSLEIRS
jgi:hypothetical protein